MQWWISVLVCGVAAAGPLEFGVSEYNAALAARNLKWKVQAELSLDPPETYRIEPYRYGGAHITGGDMRGLMYGLLEAAEQIRTNGRLTQSRGTPAMSRRGVRIFAGISDLEKYPETFWRGYFQLLARDRFNHFTLVLDPAPYPFLFAVDSYPGIRAPGLTAEQRERNLRKLRFISQTANDFGLDFTLGLWGNGGSAAEGFTGSNTGPYTREALRKLLAACPAIRNVQMQDGSEGTAFFRDYVFKALRETGHRVTLDPRGSLLRPDFLKMAEQAGVALRAASGTWPNGFELDPPLTPGRWEYEGHLQFHYLWGRLGYDPKTKTATAPRVSAGSPLKGEKPNQFEVASQLISMLAAAQLAAPDTDGNDPRASDWGSIATIAEAVHNRMAGIASGKVTALDIADRLLAAAPELDRAAAGDFQLLAKMARDQAHQLRAGYFLELSDQAKDEGSLDRAEREWKEARAAWPEHTPDPRIDMEQRIAQRRKEPHGAAREIPPWPAVVPHPQVAHTPDKTAPPEQAITLTLQINSPKDVRTVRLHYQTANRADLFRTVEKPAAASVTFTIPAEEVGTSRDLPYYFEILNFENGGWIDPDPLLPAPYHIEVANIPFAN